MRHALASAVLMAVCAALMASCAPTAPEIKVIDLGTIPTYQQPLPSGSEPGRIANYYLTSRIGLSLVDSLSRYDLLVIGLENAINNRATLEAIRTKHPGIKLLFYVQSNELSWTHDEPLNGPWHTLEARLDSTCFLHDEQGRLVSFDIGARSYDMTNPRVAQILATWIGEQFTAYGWDGVFVDNIWGHVVWYNQGHVDTDRDGVADTMSVFSHRWVTNLTALGDAVRQQVGANRLLIGNVSNDGGTTHRLWTGVANGRMFEAWPRTLPMNELADAYVGTSGWVNDPAVIVHVEANDWQFDLQRSAWAFTLLGNGYYAVDHGPTPGSGDDTGWHDETQWPGWLLQQPRGSAITAPFRDQHSGLWLREFEKIVVVWNPNLYRVTTTLITRSGQSVALAVPATTAIMVDQP